MNTAKPPYHHGDLRAALSDEALAQVRLRGCEAVSLRGVAQSVGVSASAAYHHFPDKTALMQEVSQCGSQELDRRLVEAAAAVRGRSRRAALSRLRACGTAYIQFALDEPHLFRHTFGPYCTNHMEAGDGPADDSQAYVLLCQCLDDLDGLGMLRPGAREGLDLLAWTAVHGFASLAIDGILPPEAAEELMTSLVGVVLEPAATAVATAANGGKRA